VLSFESTGRLLGRAGTWGVGLWFNGEGFLCEALSLGKIKDVAHRLIHEWNCEFSKGSERVHQ